MTVDGKIASATGGRRGIAQRIAGSVNYPARSDFDYMPGRVDGGLVYR